MILLKEKVGENHRGDYFSLMRAKPKHFQDSNIIVLFMCKKLHCWAVSRSNAPFWGCGSCGKAGVAVLVPDSISGSCAVLMPQCPQMVLDGTVGVLPHTALRTTRACRPWSEGGNPWSWSLPMFLTRCTEGPGTDVTKQSFHFLRFTHTHRLPVIPRNREQQWNHLVQNTVRFFSSSIICAERAGMS